MKKMTTHPFPANISNSCFMHASFCAIFAPSPRNRIAEVFSLDAENHQNADLHIKLRHIWHVMSSTPCECPSNITAICDNEFRQILNNSLQKPVDHIASNAKGDVDFIFNLLRLYGRIEDIPFFADGALSYAAITRENAFIHEHCVIVNTATNENTAISEFGIIDRTPRRLSAVVLFSLEHFVCVFRRQSRWFLYNDLATEIRLLGDFSEIEAGFCGGVLWVFL